MRIYACTYPSGSWLLDLLWCDTILIGEDHDSSKSTHFVTDMHELTRLTHIGRVLHFTRVLPSFNSVSIPLVQSIRLSSAAIRNDTFRPLI